MRTLPWMLLVAATFLGCVDKLADSSSGLNVACGNTCDCAAPFECVEGRCNFPLFEITFCTPNEKTCVNDFVATCKADGSAFDLDTTPCPQGCFQGACRTKWCEPASVRCLGDRQLTCNTKGLGWSVTGTCTADGGTP